MFIFSLLSTCFICVLVLICYCIFMIVYIIRFDFVVNVCKCKNELRCISHTRHIYSIDICINIYIYIHTYIHIYIYIYINIYIFIRSSNISTVIAEIRHSCYRTWPKEPIFEGFLGH